MRTVIHIRIDSPYAPCGARYKERTRVRVIDLQAVQFTNHTDCAADVSCEVCQRTRPYWRARILQVPNARLVRERPHETFRYILTDRGYRDVSTGIFHPEPGGTWTYGDWDEPVSPDEATHIMVPYTGYSDYSGGGVDKSNNRSFLRDYPEAFTQAIGGYSTEELMLSADYYAPRDPESGDSRAERTEELIRHIENLSDYPLYDEEDHSALEMEAADEAWEQFLDFDVPRRLQDESPSPEAMDDALDALDGLAARHSWESTRPGWLCECGWQAPMALAPDYREQALYRHVAEFPSLRDLFYESLRDQNESPYLETATSIVFPCMAESVEWIAERIWAMRCAELPQVPAWFNPLQARLPGMPVKREDV